MVIDKFFIHFKKPDQFLYWGENYLDLYGQDGAGKNIIKIKSFPDVPLASVTDNQFRAVARDLPALETGVLLNSQNFIFNIFEFEKLPFQENLRKELVEWRLKKVFPENLDDYEHHFYPLTRFRVLSVLFKRNMKERIQSLFGSNDVSLIHIGNSTVEMINYMKKVKNSTPDFFIEIDNSFAIAVFQEKGIPYYIRRFTVDQSEDLVTEVARTINYVKNSYSKTPSTYSIIVDRTHTDLDFTQVHDELAKESVMSKETLDREKLLFPGKKA